MPFRLFPSNWGLAGSRLEKAQAEYYLEGAELDFRLHEIEYKHKQDSIEAKRAFAELEMRHNQIDIKTYHYKLLDLDYVQGSESHKRKKLDLDRDYSEITAQAYDRELATLNGEAYFKVIDGNYVVQDNSVGGLMTFELDWNDLFVQELKKMGYTGYNDDNVVDTWFTDSCKQINESAALGYTEDPIFKS